jgi:hypothetical protein|tara:strand:+ start:382 stop:564 length:183 start_codon:yes stop_codon:yes gene_type:complete
MNKNNSAVNDTFYYIQGSISLFLILIIFSGIIYQLIIAHNSSEERIRHKVDVEIEKKLYY